jgi:hypothetical protein
MLHIKVVDNLALAGLKKKRKHKGTQGLMNTDDFMVPWCHKEAQRINKVGLQFQQNCYLKKYIYINNVPKKYKIFQCKVPRFFIMVFFKKNNSFSKINMSYTKKSAVLFQTYLIGISVQN